MPLEKMKNVAEIDPSIIIGEDYDGWINLPAWKGYQSRNGAYGSIESENTSDGIIKTHIIGVSVDYVHLLSPAQFDAIKYLNENSELVRDSLLRAIFNYYPDLKEVYDDLMPQINRIEDFKNHIGLAFLHIMDSEKDGFAYYGFELGCTWDEEHGVGVMMHKDRVIKVGLAEESFNHWTTYDDNRTSEKEQIKWEEANQKLSHKKRKWWEFWK